MNDKAVKKSYKGTTTIKGKTYDILEISFEQKTVVETMMIFFQYWINIENNLIDYFANNYQVNGGGVRFRSAYNSRKIEGNYFLGLCEF